MQQRIHSIDAIRGLCLLNIFVNHNALGYLQHFSPSKIAFFDAADVFVLLAGVSTFLAYGRLAPAAGVERMWRRAAQIYLFNLGIMAASFAIQAIGGAIALPPDPSLVPQTILEAEGPITYLWHAVTLQQSIGFSMVLRLYVFLMLAAPAYVWLASKRFWYPLVPAALIWVLSGHFGWVGVDSLTGTPLSLTILPWNLVFAIGVSLGAATMQGIALPRPRALGWGAVAFLLAIPAGLTVGAVLSPDVLDWIATRNDHFWTGASKTLQSPLRLLSLLALIYVFLLFRGAPLIRLLHGARSDNMLCRLGRRSLEVFSFGAVFALVGEQLLWLLIANGIATLHSPLAIAFELLFVGVGVFAMLRIADRPKGGAAPRPRTGRQPLTAVTK